MKKSAFRHYSLNQAKRSQLTVNRFTGVDYSTQKFLIADGKAIDLKNYIYRDGIIQKRQGYEQLLTIKDFYYVPADFDVPTSPAVQDVHNNLGDNEKRINGLWQFKAEDGLVHIVAHIGKLMYEIKKLGTDYVYADPMLTTETPVTVNGSTRSLAYEFENYKSSAFVGGNKLWFLGGNKYMCLRFLPGSNGSVRSFFMVEDSDHTPIPTTTISITYKNAPTNQRMGLDNVNLLTKWRKNKLMSGTTKQEDDKTKTTFYEYTLDAPLIVEHLHKDMAKVSMSIEEQGEIK